MEWVWFVFGFVAGNAWCFWFLAQPLMKCADKYIKALEKQLGINQ